MNGFDFYPQAWALYIALGIILLFMIDLKLRKFGFKLRVGLLSLFAVGAFTPQSVTDSDSLAPLVLTSLLNAETNGISAIYKGLLTLVITWGIVFTLALAIKHFIDAKSRKSIASNNQPEA